MEYTNGYIKLWRDLRQWEWYAEPFTKIVFIDILLSAQYSDTEYKGVPVKAGQAVIGINAIAARNGLSPQNVRTALKHLKKTGEISTSKVTNRFTVVTVENWAKFQEFSTGANTQANKQLTSNQQAVNKQANKQLTSNQQAVNKQVTTYKKIRKKEDKKERIIIKGFDEKEEKRRALDAFLEDAERRVANEE